MRLHEAKKVLHSEETVNKMKIKTYWMGEGVCKLYVWYGLIAKICKELIQLNILKK